MGERDYFLKRSERQPREEESELGNKSEPRIYLIHAMAVSIAPVERSFARLWPKAKVSNVLDDSLYADLADQDASSRSMIDRCVMLGEYCVRASADAIMFTGSAFGAAIDEVKRQLAVPVLKPNEALYDDLLAIPGRIGLLATVSPTLPSMLREIEAHAARAGASVSVEPLLIENAFDALVAGDEARHNDLVVRAAIAAAASFDALAFAQFSMTAAYDAARAGLPQGTPILTTPDSAVLKLRGLVEDTRRGAPG